MVSEYVVMDRLGWQTFGSRRIWRNVWPPEMHATKFLVARNRPGQISGRQKFPHMFMPANGNLLMNLISYVAVIWLPYLSSRISGDQKCVLKDFWRPEMQFGIFLATRNFQIHVW